jgi:diguanylate cyclase (GGDEF)-like protein
MPTLSLRQQVILPFVVLVICVSLCIGWVSIRAGENTVSDLTHRVLLETTGRIGDATERTLGGAVIALEAVAPDPEDLPRPTSFPDDFKTLEQRFWDASGLFRTVNSTVYFGGEDGRFIGVNRQDKDNVMLFVREPGTAKREAFATQAPGDRGKLLRSDEFDPRLRPWYQSARAAKHAVWSSVYNDFSTSVPVITLAKSVSDANGHMLGVLGTDMRLSALSDFLKTLEVSRNGVAFIVDEQGLLVAASTEELPVKPDGKLLQRRPPAGMVNPLLGASYAHYLAWRKANGDSLLAQTLEFEDSAGKMEMAATRVGGRHGLDWVAIVVAPRNDFMGEVTRSFYHSLAIGLVCVLIALAIGWLALTRVLNDIRQLTIAARKVGHGEPLPKLSIGRSDELGLLAQTFNEMEQNLRIDHLTGVYNRDFVLAQIGFILRQAAARPFEQVHFALLFIDLDKFKTINDVHGHNCGDVVLKTVAQRLREVVRTSDIVARYGGDEFVVLLKDVSSMRDVVATEEKIRHAVEQPIALEQDEVDVGASLGWAIFPQDGEDADTLLKVADMRMFEAKRTRRQGK